MTPWHHREYLCSLFPELMLTFSRTLSVGGFWAYGLTTEGGIRVGDDDEGA